MAPATSPVMDIGGTEAPRAVPGVVKIAGRIDAVRSYEGKTYTRILMPAADEWSGPATVEIRSRERIGSEGSDVTIDARIGGYTQSGTTKAGEPFKKAVMTLDHVDGRA